MTNVFQSHSSICFPWWQTYLWSWSLCSFLCRERRASLVVTSLDDYSKLYRQAPMFKSHPSHFYCGVVLNGENVSTQFLSFSALGKLQLNFELRFLTSSIYWESHFFSGSQCKFTTTLCCLQPLSRIEWYPNIIHSSHVRRFLTHLTKEVKKWGETKVLQIKSIRFIRKEKVEVHGCFVWEKDHTLQSIVRNLLLKWIFRKLTHQ